MHLLSRRMAAGVAIITVCLCVPRTVAAQEYERWYKQSEQQFLELKQKARGGTKMTWDKLRADEREADAGVPREVREETRGPETGRRVGPSELLPAGGVSALDHRAVSSRIHRPTRRGLVGQ
jgi:hypothetical protein